MKRILSIIIALAFSSTVSAQSGSTDNTGDLYLPSGYFNIGYALGIPVGKYGEFMPDKSYRGFMAEGRAMINPHIAVGGGMGWTGFDTKFPRATYTFDQGALTGVVKHTYYNFSMFASAYYYPLAEAAIKPYAGVNLGPVYQTIQIQAGRWYIQDQNWQMMASPEIGVFVPFGVNAQIGLNTGVRYNYVTYSNAQYGMPNGLSYFQWVIGVGFVF